MDNSFDFNENMEMARENLGKVLFHHTKLMDQFRRKLYQDAFAGYMEEARPVFLAMERACLIKPEEKTQILSSCVGFALEDFAESLKNMKKTQGRNYQDLCKMVLALYTVPMIQELAMDISDEFTDLLIEQWKKAYPDFAFKKGTYQDMVEGFEKKGFCYITTAVCRAKGKNGDCYELMMFRQFRDDYLSGQQGGKVLIDRYYRTAPQIIAAIEMRPDAEKVYHAIWERHLAPCLANIEKEEYDMCKANYENMVLELERKFLTL